MTIGSTSLNVSGCIFASAILLTSTAPKYTDTGGMMALNIPSNENRISNLGDAAHASDIACFRFFLTLAIRLDFFRVASSITTRYNRDKSDLRELLKWVMNFLVWL